MTRPNNLYYAILTVHLYQPTPLLLNTFLFPLKLVRNEDQPVSSPYLTYKHLPPAFFVQSVGAYTGWQISLVEPGNDFRLRGMDSRG